MENKKIVEVVNSSIDLPEQDREMDRRATCAIKAAVTKAKVCNRPIAKYDAEKKMAYIEYADGRRVYAK